MQAIQPVNLVTSLYGMTSYQLKKTENLGMILSLVSAFFIVLGSAIILNGLIANWGASSFSTSIAMEEKAAYLSSQTISNHITQGYYSLR